MIKIDRAVIVEGKYDKIKLQSVLDALIIETNGFGVFNDSEKRALIKKSAETKGILILTDSDSAGFKIRNYVKNIAAKGDVIHAYIPDIFGKERRKTSFSKEGKLGVEGMKPDTLKAVLEKSGVFFEEVKEDNRKKVTKLDLFEDGFSGGENSGEKRKKLLKRLELPEKMSANGLVEAINAFLSYEEYKEAANEIRRSYD